MTPIRRDIMLRQFRIVLRRLPRCAFNLCFILFRVFAFLACGVVFLGFCVVCSIVALVFVFFQLFQLQST